MCWETYKKKQYIELYTADTDIPVIKVVEKTETGYRPWYMKESGVLYRTGKTETAEIGKPEEERDMWHINEGIHSYDASCTNVFYMNNTYLYPDLTGTGGVIVVLASWRATPPTYYAALGGKPVILDCVIPKGAKFYENEFGECVSNKIRVIGERKEG